MGNSKDTDYHSFWKMAVTYPHQTAIVEQNGRSITYAELNNRCNQIVHGLDSLGFVRGDTVSILSGNSIDYIAITLAILQSGMRLVPINHDLSVSMIGGIVNDSLAKALIAFDPFLEKLKRISPLLNGPNIQIFIMGNHHRTFQSFDEIVNSQPVSIPQDRCAGEFTFITSGTTGKPKGVIRPLKLADPDEKAALSATSFLKMFDIAPRKKNTYLATMPLYYSANLYTAICSLHFGHTVILMRSWTVDKMVELINSTRVTYALMSPVMFSEILKQPETVKESLRNTFLRCVIHSGLSCAVDVKQRIIDLLGPIIYEYYAGAEGGGTIITAGQWLAKPGSVGRPWPISSVKICDHKFRKLSAGKVGRVYIRTMNQSFEYYKDHKATEQAWQDGYFTLGDTGYLDEDGYLFLKDRESELINLDGEKFSPSEIEIVLNQHHAVQEAAVFGIPKGTNDEEIKAVVQLADDYAPGLELTENILAHCRLKLGQIQTPTAIKFVDEFHRYPTGKLKKQMLRNHFLS